MLMLYILIYNLTEYIHTYVIFSDFYCLINTKFWITNKKMFIKKSLSVKFIASFYNCKLHIKEKH